VGCNVFLREAASSNKRIEPTRPTLGGFPKRPARAAHAERYMPWA